MMTVSTAKQTLGGNPIRKTLIILIGAVSVINFYLGHKASVSLRKSASSMDDCTKEGAKYIDGSTHSDRKRKMILTIAIDSQQSCPRLCTFVHPILPPWVSYRYISFQDATDLAAALESDHVSHLLIVARINIKEQLATFAMQRRKLSGLSVGLWHMADEGVGRDYGHQIKPYPAFDYVLRHYREHPVKYTNYTFYERYNMTLRTLGNLTCGTSLTPLPEKETETSPRFGVHYVFLDPREWHVMYNHPGSSVWPTHLRPRNCSFIGSIGEKHIQLARELMANTMNKYPELNCTMVLHTDGFAAGKETYNYVKEELQDSKIVLCPRGASIETHRLTEALAMGSVPALLDAKYIHSLYREIPAIVGQDWDEIASKIKELIEDELKGGKQLQLLGLQGAMFYSNLKSCQKSDMEKILSMILDYYHVSTKIG
jgi:hypothetical protein